MFCHVFTGVLFYMVFISKESFGTDVNEILRNPGWERITTVGAKNQMFLNKIASFTGKDLFVSDNPSIDNENSVNTSVGEHNESVKHYMVTHLLACVYVNATVKFAELIKRILEVYDRAIHNARIQARNRQNKNKSKNAEADKAKKEDSVDKSLEGCEEKSDISQDRLANEEVDKKMAYKVFVFAVVQLTSSSSMFDLMYSAMKYLTDMIPSDKWFDEFTRYKLINQVLPSLKVFKDKSKNVNLVLPKYAGATDDDYSNKLPELSFKLKRFLNNQIKMFLLPFLDLHCTISISETDIPSVSEQYDAYKEIYLRQPTPLDVANLFAIEISRLVNEEVCKNYYSELGFLYNIGDQTTSFQRPPSPPSPPSPETSQNLTELQLFI